MCWPWQTPSIPLDAPSPLPPVHREHTRDDRESQRCMLLRLKYLLHRLQLWINIRCVINLSGDHLHVSRGGSGVGGFDNKHSRASYLRLPSEHLYMGSGYMYTASCHSGYITLTFTWDLFKGQVLRASVILHMIPAWAAPEQNRTASYDKIVMT